MAGAGDAGLAGESGGEEAVGGGGLRKTAGAGLEAGSSALAAGFIARESLSVPLRLPNTTVLHSGGYFARNFSIRGDRNEPRGFLVSPRPVNRCAICRNISVARWLAEISAIIWPLFAAEPNICGSNGIAAIGWLSIALANSFALISGRFGMPT